MHRKTNFCGESKQNQGTGSTDADQASPCMINQQRVIDGVPRDGHRVSAPHLPRRRRW